MSLHPNDYDARGTVIVGICGGLRSGKSTLAQMFSSNHSDRVRRISFADGVREQVAQGMNLIHPVELVRFDKQILRPILQAWGNGMRELKGEDYWIDYMLDQPFWSLIPDNSVVIIDDVRYLNEAAFIIEEGGFLIRLDCDEQTRIERGAKNDETELNHPSEVGLDGFSSYLTTVDTSSTTPAECYSVVYEVLRSVGVF